MFSGLISSQSLVEGLSSRLNPLCCASLNQKALFWFLLAGLRYVLLWELLNAKCPGRSESKTLQNAYV